MEAKSLYYLIKPLIPRPVQILVRRRQIRVKRLLHKKHWPVDTVAAQRPDRFNGWPGKKLFALILTHDVDTDRGQNRCLPLKAVESRLGFHSSFNFVPERYHVDPQLRQELSADGFEVGVHGLNHDGKLYNSKVEFDRRAKSINLYLKEWNAVGFRSPAMHHNLEWLKSLEIAYDASTFDIDPFEPQPDGVGTIFPFWVARDDGTGYVELPYTLPQDFTLFVLMREKTAYIWKTKLDWIVENGGMALVNTHPDYMHFGPGKPGLEEYPVEMYEEFLIYVNERYNGQYWHALPHEVAQFWRKQHFFRQAQQV